MACFSSLEIHCKVGVIDSVNFESSEREQVVEFGDACTLIVFVCVCFCLTIGDFGNGGNIGAAFGESVIIHGMALLTVENKFFVGCTIEDDDVGWILLLGIVISGDCWIEDNDENGDGSGDGGKHGSATVCTISVGTFSNRLTNLCLRCES